MDTELDDKMRSRIRTLDEIRLALRVYGRADLCDDLGDVLTEIESEACHRGFSFVADLAQRDREHFRDLLLQVVAAIDSKDRADGVIRYEVYPDPAIYDRV